MASTHRDFILTSGPNEIKRIYEACYCLTAEYGDTLNSTDRSVIDTTLNRLDNAKSVTIAQFKNINTMLAKRKRPPMAVYMSGNGKMGGLNDSQQASIHKQLHREVREQFGLPAVLHGDVDAGSFDELPEGLRAAFGPTESPAAEFVEAKLPSRRETVKRDNERIAQAQQWILDQQRLNERQQQPDPDDVDIHDLAAMFDAQGSLHTKLAENSFRIGHALRSGGNDE